MNGCYTANLRQRRCRPCLPLVGQGERDQVQPNDSKTRSSLGKRCWLQFSLRTLLLVVLLASAGMSWMVVKVQQARRQRQAVEAIRALGGFVTYDYAIDQAYGHPVNAEAPGPGWLGSVLGADFFADVVRVNCDGFPEYLGEAYESIRYYYRAAAQNGNAMLKWID